MLGGDGDDKLFGDGKDKLDGGAGRNVTSKGSRAPDVKPVIDWLAKWPAGEMFRPDAPRAWMRDFVTDAANAEVHSPNARLRFRV